LRMALRLRLGGSVVGSELGPLPEEAGSATRREEPETSRGSQRHP